MKLFGLRAPLTVLAAVGIAALVPIAATPAEAAEPSPTSGPVARAGTTFLSAAAIGAGQQVSVAAATGEYLYWSFTAKAGEIYDINASVALAAGAERHGTQSWIVEVFDGLRRRQACVAGAQSALIQSSNQQASLRCTLRRVRSWAEPWSGDPLPGSYYVRLSTSDLPEQDLGQQAKVELLLDAESGDVSGDDGELAAPLTPVNKPGTVTAAGTGSGTGATAGLDATADDDDDLLDIDLPSFSARWFWTAGGGVLAAVLGVVGFGLTRKPRGPRV